jgi:hypothetical protein
MKKIVSVCIIGGNYGLKVLLPAIRGIKNVYVKGVAIKKLRKNKNISFFYSWKQMIKECKPDLVLISVPPRLQSNIIKYIIKKNINFLAEKPLSYKFIDAKKILNLFKKKRIKAAIDLNFLKIPAILKYKKLLKELKDLKFSIEIQWLFRSGSLKEKKNWKNKIKDGGGLYLNFGFHLISLIIYLFGDIKYLKRFKKDKNIDFLKGKTKSGQAIKIKISNNYLGQNFFSIQTENIQKEILALENRSVNYHGNFIIYKKNNLNKKNIIFKEISKDPNKSRIIYSRLIIKELVDCINKKKYMLFNNIKHAVNVHRIISNI